MALIEEILFVDPILIRYNEKNIFWKLSAFNDLAILYNVLMAAITKNKFNDE